MDIKERQRRIIDYYGMEHQLNKLIEEAAELIQAIIKFDRAYETDCAIERDSLIEEMADVKNLIEQIEISNLDVKDGMVEVCEYKVNRQLERIEEGY